MFTKGSLFHILHHPVIDRVGAGGNRPVQTAAAANRVKIRQLEAALLHRCQHGRLAVVRLINHPFELIQLLCGVIQPFLKKLLLLLKNGDLGGGGTGVNNQNLHKNLLFHFSSLKSGIFQNIFSLNHLPNHLLNNLIIGFMHSFVNVLFAFSEKLG